MALQFFLVKVNLQHQCSLLHFTEQPLKYHLKNVGGYFIITLQS